MLNFEEKRRQLRLTATEMELRIYERGLKSKNSANPYSKSDLRSYCLFAAGVNDK